MATVTGGNHRNQHQHYAEDAQHDQHLFGLDLAHQRAAGEAARHDEQVVGRRPEFQRRLQIADSLLSTPCEKKNWMALAASAISTPT
jgi:serine phosphatase RsbU (regulator of sigma subunit)